MLPLPDGAGDREPNRLAEPAGNPRIWASFLRGSTSARPAEPPTSDTPLPSTWPLEPALEKSWRTRGDSNPYRTVQETAAPPLSYGSRLRIELWIHLSRPWLDSGPASPNRPKVGRTPASGHTSPAVPGRMFALERLRNRAFRTPEAAKAALVTRGGLRASNFDGRGAPRRGPSAGNYRGCARSFLRRESNPALAVAAWNRRRNTARGFDRLPPSRTLWIRTAS